LLKKKGLKQIKTSKGSPTLNEWHPQWNRYENFIQHRCTKS